jgi:hypothetical protein
VPHKHSPLTLQSSAKSTDARAREESPNVKPDEEDNGPHNSLNKSDQIP